MELKTKVFHNLTCHQHALKSEQKNKYTVASEQEALCITQRNSSKENGIACWNQNAYWSANPYIYTKRKKKRFCFFLKKQRTPNPPSCNFLALCWLNDDWGKGPAYMVFYVFCVHPWRLPFLQVIAQHNFKYLRLKIHGSGFQLSPYEKVDF